MSCEMSLHFVDILSAQIHSQQDKVLNVPINCRSIVSSEDGHGEDMPRNLDDESAAERELWLTLTSRPGGGGSPTTRCTLLHDSTNLLP